MKYGDPIYFNDTFIINYDEIERKNKILNFKNFVNNKIHCFNDLINTDYFVFDKYIKLETINKIFGLNGICQVMNSLYIIKNNDISNLIKCSNYGKYYNWIIASAFTAIIFMKVNYVYHNIYDIFNLVTFSEADYTADELKMASRLMTKIEQCSNSKLNAKKRAMWQEFLVDTVSNLGQSTSTGSIVQAVGGLTSGGGGMSSLGTLGSFVTQTLMQ